jgi:hypothetical protein
MDKLPTYKITIDPEYSEGEDLGIEMIAFTSRPAVKVKGVAFNSHEQMYFADEVKMRIVAPAMIPMEIYRNDEGEEYYVSFTAEEIEKIHAKFMENLSNKDIFNIEHNAENKVPAYVLEAWIVQDPKNDKAKAYGIDVPKGTLMLTAQVTDEDYYNELVKSNQVGFSIEGFLGMKLNEQKTELNNQYSMKLPDGEHLIEGKIYVVKGGEVIEVLDAPTEEVVMETEVIEEEVKEEEMATEEVVEEEVATEEVEMAVDPTADAEAILAIVTPLLDEKVNELLQVIAELKNSLEVEVEPIEEELKETKLSAHEKFNAFRDAFSKK